MGNGFNDADRLGTRGWKGGSIAILQKIPGTTNAQRAKAEELRVRNDVSVELHEAQQHTRHPRTLTFPMPCFSPPTACRGHLSVSSCFIACDVFKLTLALACLV